MKIQIFNTNGLVGKADAIERFANEQKTDICATFETWLAPNATVPFPSVVADHRCAISEVIVGGRRYPKGVLVHTNSAAYRTAARELHTALDNNAAVVDVNGVTFIFAYLPPSYKPDTCMQDLVDLANSLVDAGASRCVIAGDLNARSMALAGDHLTNTRGRNLEAALDGSTFLVQRPVSGQWTSFNGGGHGIPDLVIANFPIKDVTVHEHESCGGSDHRPLTFTVPDQPPTSKLVERWNIRRLLLPWVEKKYNEALQEEMATVPMVVVCEEFARRVREEGLAGAELQEVVDDRWAELTECVQRAADRTVGRLKFQSRLPQDFFTAELEGQRDQLLSAQVAAQEAQLEGTESQLQIWLRYRALTNAAKQYRVSLRHRRTQLFTSAVDKLSHPSNMGAFMRMVKGARKRKTGRGCKLDPEKIDSHIEHFRSTFGGDPTGTLLTEANLAAAPPPACELNLGLVVNIGTVTEKVKALPRGKAWGVDDIPAEFLQAGITHLAKPLTAFLSLVFTAEKIPTAWRTALVVPVWKKKGSETDIAMHRPISLTCTGRRLYERLLLADVNRFTDQLADAQGGFRPHRGCPHQALTLHEALVANPNARAALLDLRAAYDLANRERLWQMLATKYGFPPHSVRRLADLFDHNVSNLLVGGQHSKDLHNARGLLQGSSLSPVLFNFLINELALELETGPGGVLVHGKQVRGLLFADDTALISASEHALAEQLAICERWSIQAGMEFSPAKCLCFAPQPHQRETPLRLYGQDLPSVEKATYLGFPFTPSGINFALLCEQRCKAARGVVSTMQSIGLNITGWAPAAAARIYIAFIRPTMEYGVELKLPTPTLTTMYQRTQNMALRTICSATGNTSVAAMHRLLGIQMFKERAAELNFLSAARFHNNDDASVIGVDIWRRALQPQRAAPQADSLPRHTMHWNPLAEEFRPQLMDHTAVPLTRVSPEVRPCPLTATERKARRIRGLAMLDANTTGIAASVKVREDGKPHHLLTVESKVSRPDRVSITRWQLGMVAAHQECKKCGEEVSREHAVQCAGVMADGEFAGMVAAVPLGERVGRTEIDMVINHSAEEMSLQVAEVLVRVIDGIEQICRGRERTEMGFWR
jgi:hypothetical protein